LKVITGLGNPGASYASTRHNVGWWLLDHLVEQWHLDGWRRDGEALVAAGRFGDEAVRLVKPQTYMNLSGAVLAPYKRRAGWNAPTDLLVVSDDVALPVGAFRLRARGSAGGHNGLKSIEQALGNQDYARLRIGIKPVPDRPIGDLADFVLSRFAASERETVMSTLPRLAAATESWVRNGIERAMTDHNGPPTTPE
jgi:peptidyl-tRNA hydrolase, PTH1 family